MKLPPVVFRNITGVSPSNRGRKTSTLHRKVLSSSPVFCNAKYRGGVTEVTEGLHFIENLFDCFFNLLPKRPECICRQAHSSLKYMSTPRIFLLNLKRTVKLRSCFKFIPRQGLNMAGTYLLAIIILFLNKFKTASNISST